MKRQNIEEAKGKNLKEETKMKKMKFWEQEAKEAKRALRVMNLQIGNSSKIADLKLLEQRNGEVAWMLNEAGNEEEAEIFLGRAEYYKNLQEEAKGKNIEEAEDKNIEEAEDKNIKEETEMRNVNVNEEMRNVNIEEAEEQILMEITAAEESCADVEATGYDPLEAAEIKKEEIDYALEMISIVLRLEDLVEEDLVEDVRSKISALRRREEEAEREISYWREEYGIFVWRA